MRDAGVDVRLDITDRATVGFSDHWRSMPAFLRAWRFWRQQVGKPDLLGVLLIDAPGVNLPFARLARARELHVTYYVPPQTWLWNPTSAAARLRNHANIVVATMLDEAEIYRQAGLNVIYEGYPALDDIAHCPRGSTGERPQSPGRLATVGIVPGSRRHAIRRLLPIMLETVDLMRAHGEIDAMVSVAAGSLRDEVQRRVRDRPALALEDGLQRVLAKSDVVLASMGTNLIEAVFAGVPAVACYRVDGFSHAIARHVLGIHRKMDRFALPNLVAGRSIIPEMVQSRVTASAMAEQAMRLLGDAEARKEMLEGYALVRERLGAAGATARIASEWLRRMT